MTTASKRRPQRASTTGRSTSGVQPAVRPRTLADGALAFWLIRAIDTRFSGTMSLAHARSTHRLAFDSGAVVGVDNAMVLPSLREPDNRAALKVNSLFGLPRETIVEVEAGEPPSGLDPVSMPPLPLVVRGLRAEASRHEPPALLAPLADRELRLHRDAPLDDLGLLPFEAKIVAALRARACTVKELSAQRFAHRRALGSTLFILNAVRFFEGFFDAAGPVCWRAAPPSARPRSECSPKRAVVDRRYDERSLRRRLEEMATETPFEILEAPLSATDEQIRGAHAAQLFLYHPDRLRGRASPVALRLCASICQRLNDARAELADRDKRRHKRELTMAGSSARARADATTKAVELVANAERAMRRGDFGQAEEDLLAAIQRDGECPRYPAILAWCRAQSVPLKKGKGIDRRYDAMLRTLRVAVRVEPDCASSRYYFGQVLLRSGRVDAAMRQFEIVLELQPHNTGAARLLRIHEMRQRRRSAKGLIERVWSGGSHR